MVRTIISFVKIVLNYLCVLERGNRLERKSWIEDEVENDSRLTTVIICLLVCLFDCCLCRPVSLFVALLTLICLFLFPGF